VPKTRFKIKKPKLLHASADNPTSTEDNVSLQQSATSLFGNKKLGKQVSSKSSKIISSFTGGPNRPNKKHFNDPPAYNMH